jgi:hypothetical protein
MYQLTISYDGKLMSSHNFTDALSAVETFQKCVDAGDAKEFATYNLMEPSGKMHTRWFSRDGKSGGK